MLTLEETRWSLKAFKICSILNILPIGVDVKNGKIQRQPNEVKVFLWKIIFGVGVSHWFYIFGRLVQSTVIEPEKYFRWDHFVIHFGLTCLYAAFYFTGFYVFVKHAEENVMIFNQLFTEREDPVQKMMERQLQLQKEAGNGKRGNKTRTKSATASRSARKPHEEIEMEVIENPWKSESESKARPRPLLTWPSQYSLDELLAKLLPVILLCTGFSMILVLAIDPSRPQLLYSVLPPEWQNPWSFCILMAVEALCLLVIYLTCSFKSVTQVLFFGKCQLEFSRLSLQLRNLEEKFQNRSLEIGEREIEREIEILRQIFGEIRELVVFIKLFNRCFPFCIFAWKICSLSMAIMWYFFVVRHFQDFPFLGVFLGYGAIAVTLVYTILYADAFSIPGKMDKLKTEFLLTAQKTTKASKSTLKGNKKVWAEMKREVKRIRNVGIKVGGFHQMERESTPNFIDFVLRNVVNLLVTFPR